MFVDVSESVDKADEVFDDDTISYDGERIAMLDIEPDAVFTVERNKIAHKIQGASFLEKTIIEISFVRFDEDIFERLVMRQKRQFPKGGDARRRTCQLIAYEEVHLRDMVFLI